MAEPDEIGQSGITYHCRCGASSAKQRDNRAQRAEGWGLTYVAIEATERVGTTKKERTVTRHVAVYLCPTCNPRGNLAKAPAG